MFALCSLYVRCLFAACGGRQLKLSSDDNYNLPVVRG
jgi:hypothetical protein